MFPDEKYMNLDSENDDLKFGFFSYFSSNSSRGNCPCENSMNDSNISNPLELSPSSIDNSFTKDGTSSSQSLNDPISIQNNASYNLAYSTFLKFVNLLPNSPLLNISLDNGQILFQNIEYNETTGYLPLYPKEYNLRAYDNNLILRNIEHPSINLKPNKFYTLSVVGSIDSPNSLKMLISEDSTKK